MFFDHVEYQVSDYKNSFKFYSACLIPLGFLLTTNNEKRGMFGFGLSTDKSDDLLLTAGEPTRPVMHICFSAKSTAQVDEFYQQAIKAGAFAMAHQGFGNRATMPLSFAIPMVTTLKPYSDNNNIGARGCTPQSCSFRDLIGEFNALGVQVYGLSIQSPEIQKEFVARNHISFPILSDHQYQLTEQLNLPTFDFEGERLIKRMAFFIRDGKIQKVFYPVFPPDKNAEEVLSWLRTSQS